MSPVKMSKVESGVRAVIAFNEAFNRHDIEGMVQFISEVCRLDAAQPAPDGNLVIGKAAITSFWQAFFSTSSEAQRQIEDISGFGERCIMCWHGSWLDANGEKVHIRGADIFRVRDGLIQEQLSYVKGCTHETK